MTCREKLMKEHPDQVGEIFWGGCAGCPSEYKYLDDPEYCQLDVPPNDEECTKCWDRKIPGTFGTWTKIVPGCVMPEPGDEVLILIHDQGYPSYRQDIYEVDIGVYSECEPYILTPCDELGGFITVNDWCEGQDIKVIAWMPKPPAKLEE